MPRCISICSQSMGVFLSPTLCVQPAGRSLYYSECAQCINVHADFQYVCHLLAAIACGFLFRSCEDIPLLAAVC